MYTQDEHDNTLAITVEQGRLLNKGSDISDSMSSAEFKAQADTLMLYAKFKLSVERAAAQCFGEPKKRKSPVKKAKPAEVPTLVDNAYLDMDNGHKVDVSTGEIF